MNKKIIFITILIFLVSCQSAQWKQDSTDLLNWTYKDLRMLDPIDATMPSQDMIAVYTKIDAKIFQIRIDFLDLSSNPGMNIYIPIDTNPGGINQIKTSDNRIIPVDVDWDYLIRIPSSGIVEIVDDRYSQVYGTDLLIVHNTKQDFIVASLERESIPISLIKTKMQVIITSPNQDIIQDKCPSFSIDTPPPARAQVIFAFWNTFSSATPAQTLRSWAGVHAGPVSSRHGLQYLLNEAAEENSTIFLLDLLTPNTLSALDYINALPLIRRLANQGVIVLPQKDYQSLAGGNNKVTESNKAMDIDFNKIWNLGYNISNDNLVKEENIIILLNNYVYLNNLNYNLGDNDYAYFNNYLHSCSITPGFENYSYQDVNFSSSCKKLFVTYAFMNISTPLVLGGDFSKSSLGNPSISIEVFSYIKAHPWIQVLTANDLASESNHISSTSLPLSSNMPSINLKLWDIFPYNPTTISPIQFNIYQSLINSPQNQFSKLAWQVYESLTQTDSAILSALNSNYIGQVGQILAAANWANNPMVQNTCNIDLDYDGKYECVLSNKNIFMVIEPEGGYIAFVFSIDKQGMHQIIGPTWEFMVGISDPSTWNLQLGLRSDAEQILGAFQDPFSNWNVYRTSISDNKVVLTNDNLSIQKSFSLNIDSINININNSMELANKQVIPLAIDPWFRYTSGWGDLYIGYKYSLMFQWGIRNSYLIDIHSNNPITGIAFNDTRSALSRPENPNYDYKQGHYLPYPMAIAEIDPSKNISVSISINH